MNNPLASISGLCLHVTASNETQEQEHTSGHLRKWMSIALVWVPLLWFDFLGCFWLELLGGVELCCHDQICLATWWVIRIWMPIIFIDFNPCVQILNFCPNSSSLTLWFSLLCLSTNNCMCRLPAHYVCLPIATYMQCVELSSMCWHEWVCLWNQISHYEISFPKIGVLVHMLWNGT